MWISSRHAELKNQAQLHANRATMVKPRPARERAMASPAKSITTTVKPPIDPTIEAVSYCLRLLAVPARVAACSGPRDSKKR